VTILTRLTTGCMVVHRWRSSSMEHHSSGDGELNNSFRPQPPHSGTGPDITGFIQVRCARD
jgi:hypothetical protein